MYFPKLSLIAVLLRVSAAQVVTPPERTCEQLDQRFGDAVAFQNEASYIADNTYWASNAAQTPPCIFTPTTALALSRGLRYLVATNTTFTVRSGGHAFIPGWSSSSVSVSINLKHLSSISVASDQKSATIGAGSRWGDVYAALEPRGLTVPGARASTVGVGGYTLGGGISFFGTSVGFACDNVLQYEVVLADGRIVIARARGRHAALFRALKGSGAPFAVVTAITFRTIRLKSAKGLVWGGLVTSFGPAVDPKGIISAVAGYVKKGIKDKNAHLISGVGIAQGPNGSVLDVGLNVLFYAQPPPFTATPTTPEAVPDSFTAIHAAATPGAVLNTLATKPLSMLTREIAGEGQPITRHEMLSLDVINPTEGLLTALHAAFKEEFAPVAASVAGFVATLNFCPFGTAMVGAGERIGGRNIMGLRKDVDYMSVQFLLQWVLPSDDETAHAALRRASDRCIAIAKQARKFTRNEYINYANPDQDPIASYGHANVAFLQRVQHAYDPTGVWKRLVLGGFKIPKRGGY